MFVEILKDRPPIGLPNSQRAIARRHRREAFKYSRQVIDEAFEPWGDSLIICQKDVVAVVGLASVAGCLLKEGDSPPSLGSIKHGFGRPGPEIVDTDILEWRFRDNTLLALPLIQLCTSARKSTPINNSQKCASH